MGARDPLRGAAIVPRRSTRDSLNGGELLLRSWARFLGVAMCFGWVALIGIQFYLSWKLGESWEAEALGNVPYALVSYFMLFGALASWVLAVIVWSRVPRQGIGHTLVAVPLVLLGFFWSHFYLIARAGELPKSD